VGRITISNVGDSRAILGTQRKHQHRTNIQAVPLSKDHTPYRSEEAQRCKAKGARILSFGEISGIVDDESETEDPPRIWHPTAKYPGTAFTRSIGDSRADPLGVIAEPEMMTLKLSANEKIIVLASDGIFDVLSNQQVIDICSIHHGDGNPAVACHAVIEQAHWEWLKNEECLDGNDIRANYDDMTITCIFIFTDNDEETNAMAQTTTTAAAATVAAAVANTDTQATTNDTHMASTATVDAAAAAVTTAAATTTTTTAEKKKDEDIKSSLQKQQQEQDEAQPKRRRARQKTLRNLEDDNFFAQDTGGGSDNQ
jgi:hypothetical protein